MNLETTQLSAKKLADFQSNKTFMEKEKKKEKKNRRQEVFSAMDEEEKEEKNHFWWRTEQENGNLRNELHCSLLPPDSPCIWFPLTLTYKNL